MSKAIYFINKTKEQDPKIKLGNEEIEYTNNHTIFGVIFDALK